MKKRTNFIEVLRVLIKHEVRFIVVGGLSGVLHGAPITTFDLDILHERTEQNVNKLLDALSELDAYYRMKKELRIRPDYDGLIGKGHHLLITQAGPLDVLGILGNLKSSWDYDVVVEDVEVFEVGELKVFVQSLENLIEVKEFIGRQKDLVTLPVLRSALKMKLALKDKSEE